MVDLQLRLAAGTETQELVSALQQSGMTRDVASDLVMLTEVTVSYAVR